MRYLKDEGWIGIFQWRGKVDGMSSVFPRPIEVTNGD